jgi:predicted nucleic acid-binding protein
MPAVYFADTFWWIALGSPKDSWPARVVAWAAAHQGARYLTTEEVLSELLTWFAPTGPAGRALAGAMVRGIMSDLTVQVLPQTSADFTEALALYEAKLDKTYNLTDCRSMLAARGPGLKDVLTHDNHFTQEGFTILFP